MVNTILGALLIFGLRMCDVSLGTVRMLVSIQGRRFLAAGIAFVEVTIFVVAIGKVISQLDNVYNVLAYSGGFACGTIVGIYLESKLALGNRVVQVITRRQNDPLVEALREAGFGVTCITGEGREGTVYILFSVVTRKALESYLAITSRLVPEAFVTIEDARQTIHGHLPILGRLK